MCVSLVCDILKCILPSSTFKMRQKGKKGLESEKNVAPYIGYGSDKIFSLKSRTSLWRILWMQITKFIFSTSCQSHERIIFGCSLGKLSGIPESKAHTIKSIIQEFLILKLVHTQPPVIHQSYHLNVPNSSCLQWFLIQISQSWL